MYKKVEKTVFNVENVKSLGFEKFAEQHSFLSDPKHVYETVTGEKVEEKKESPDKLEFTVEKKPTIVKDKK